MAAPVLLLTLLELHVLLITLTVMLLLLPTLLELPMLFSAILPYASSYTVKGAALGGVPAAIPRAF